MNGVDEVYKYVIFDFDGTLVDSKITFISSWNILAKKYNYREINMDGIEELSNLSMKEKMTWLNIPFYRIPFIAPKLYKLYRNSIHDIQLFEGIKDMLVQLEKKGYKTSIISSNSKENIRFFLEQNNIHSVNTIHCSSNIFGKDKLIYKFLRDHQLKSSDVIYVGDEQRDIVACKKTGVKMIWVGWGYDSIEVIEKEKPDYQVYRPVEILKVI